MKPTHLTINTSLPPNLPYYTTIITTTTTTTTEPLSQRRRTLLALLTFAALTTLSLLYFHPPSTTFHITTTRTTPRTFVPNPSYNDLSPSADGNWTSLLPPNGGFLSQRVGKKEDGHYEMVGLTMFHQLHCLSMIRGALQQQQSKIEMFGDGRKGREGAETDRRKSGEDGEDLFGVRRKRSESGEDFFGVRRKRNAQSEEGLSGVGKKKTSEEGHLGVPEHYLHCFDYLVQTILCNADATLERAHEIEDGRIAVDGYDVQRQCKNSDAVWARVMGANSVPGWKLNPQDAREPEFEMMKRRYS
ncbi:hypothetical protein BLS_008442 [Venturia inaequalis]|uniref:Uncharacterized protein n=1 Tax=Venturia inaequalis TaxID=5025 RepID=A0A8H3U790_VENIN|nr:hypothetical protein BLS_008442 [Venturia inaequalis]